MESDDNDNKFVMMTNDSINKVVQQNKIKSVFIKIGVTEIGGLAFSNWTALTSVVFEIPSSVRVIGKGAFQGCSALTSVIIPSSVILIKEEAFYVCISLTSVIIPSSVKNIEKNAFKGCLNLTSVEIPSSVTNIGNDAFPNDKNLTITIKIDGDNGSRLKEILQNKFPNIKVIIDNSITASNKDTKLTDENEEKNKEYIIKYIEKIKGGDIDIKYIENNTFPKFLAYYVNKKEYDFIIKQIIKNVEEILSNKNQKSEELKKKIIEEVEEILNKEREKKNIEELKKKIIKEVEDILRKSNKDNKPKDGKSRKSKSKRKLKKRSKSKRKLKKRSKSKRKLKKRSKSKRKLKKSKY